MLVLGLIASGCAHNITQPEDFRSSACDSAIRSTERFRNMLYQNQALRVDFFLS